MEDLQRMLKGNPKLYADIDRVLTIKMLRSSEEYISCPNKECNSFGFIQNDMLCCAENYQCTECNISWRLPGQMKLRTENNPLMNLFNSLIHSMLDKLYNYNTYSDLYKVLFA